MVPIYFLPLPQFSQNHAYPKAKYPTVLYFVIITYRYMLMGNKYILIRLNFVLSSNNSNTIIHFDRRRNQLVIEECNDTYIITRDGHYLHEIQNYPQCGNLPLF